MPKRQTNAEVIAEMGRLWKKHRINSLDELKALVNVTSRADRAATRVKKQCRPYEVTEVAQ